MIGPQWGKEAYWACWTWTPFSFIIEPLFNKSVKKKFLFTMTAYPGQTLTWDHTGPIVHRPMGLPIMAACGTAWNRTRASRSEMQCLRALRHSGYLLYSTWLSRRLFKQHVSGRTQISDRHNSLWIPSSILTLAGHSEQRLSNTLSNLVVLT